MGGIVVKHPAMEELETNPLLVREKVRERLPRMQGGVSRMGQSNHKQGFKFFGVSFKRLTEKQPRPQSKMEL